MSLSVKTLAGKGSSACFWSSEFGASLCWAKSRARFTSSTLLLPVLPLGCASAHVASLPSATLRIQSEPLDTNNLPICPNHPPWSAPKPICPYPAPVGTLVPIHSIIGYKGALLAWAYLPKTAAKRHSGTNLPNSASSWQSLANIPHSGTRGWSRAYPPKLATRGHSRADLPHTATNSGSICPTGALLGLSAQFSHQHAFHTLVVQIGHQGAI